MFIAVGHDVDNVKLTRRFARNPRLLRAIARPVARLEAASEPLFAVNSYGLFAVMTTRRPEIVVEGSRDGVTWREYGFRYKPGAPSHVPRQVAPHQPHLDGQIWFAALGPPPSGSRGPTGVTCKGAVTSLRDPGMDFARAGLLA